MKELADRSLRFVREFEGVSVFDKGEDDEDEEAEDEEEDDDDVSVFLDLLKTL